MPIPRDGRVLKSSLLACATGRSTLLLCLLVGIAAPRVTAAQTEGVGETAQGVITGMVVDADVGYPLAGARVFLEPLESPLLARQSHNGSDGSPAFRFYQVALTDVSGEYRFERIPPGRYRLHVERAGYGRAQVEVELALGTARVVLGVPVEPIALPNLTVSGDAAQPYARTASGRAERLGARRSAVLERQRRHLETDVRTLTAGQVAEAVTAGEADLFRALQRLPGVGRRDDYTAVLWTRGAPWVETRVYFDGMPLYNPTHAGSLFASISPNGVGEVTYHPGVRSAQWGEGAAGILDIRSRSGHPYQNLSGSMDLSLVSAQASLDGSLLNGRVRWMVAGRRTHVDLLAEAWQYLYPRDPLRVPYDFSDLTTRLDVDLGPVTLEASRLVERDRLRGDIPGLLVGNTGHWGNRLAQVTARLPLGPVEISASHGGTRYATLVNESWRTPTPDGDDVTLPALESGIDHDRTGARITSFPGAFGRLDWALGYEKVEERIRYDGPFSLLAEGIPGLVRDSLARVPFRLTGAREYDALWGQARLELLPGLEVETGLRVEVGDSVRNMGDRLVSPRFSTRLAVTPELAVSAGWGRSFQYTQAIGAAAGPLGPQLHLGHLWVLAGRGYPALRADVASLGGEYWLDRAWLLGAAVYHRESTGITEPDPTPGEIRPDRSHVEADGTAYGLEFSLRRLVGRLTGSLGYSLARSELRVDTLTYPGSADIRHSLDATTGYHLNDDLRLGAAFSLASGVPFTRVTLDGSGAHLGDPGAHRTPVFASLDLRLDYSTELGGRPVGAYVQLINALNRRNRVTYAGSVDRCNPAVRSLASTGDALDCSAGPVIHDRFRSGLPRLPLVGFRVAF
jgi:hypothetical protein